MALHGMNVLVYRGDVLIGGMKSDEITTDVDLVEKSVPGSGTWKSYVPARCSWKISIGYLVLSDSVLGRAQAPVAGVRDSVDRMESGIRDVLSIGTSFTLKFKDVNRNGVTGSAILKTVRITAIHGNLVQGSFEFVGNGSLS
jgi:hypothetical protein